MLIFKTILLVLFGVYTKLPRRLLLVIVLLTDPINCNNAHWLLFFLFARIFWWIKFFFYYLQIWSKIFFQISVIVTRSSWTNYLSLEVYTLHNMGKKNLRCGDNLEKCKKFVVVGGADYLKICIRTTRRAPMVMLLL